MSRGFPSLPRSLLAIWRMERYGLFRIFSLNHEVWIRMEEVLHISRHASRNF